MSKECATLCPVALECLAWQNQAWSNREQDLQEQQHVFNPTLEAPETTTDVEFGKALQNQRELEQAIATCKGPSSSFLGSMAIRGRGFVDLMRNAGTVEATSAAFTACRSTGAKQALRRLRSS